MPLHIYEVVNLLDGPLIVFTENAKFDVDEYEWLLRQDKVTAVEHMGVDEHITHELERRLDPKTYNKLVLGSNPDEDDDEPLLDEVTAALVRLGVIQISYINVAVDRIDEYGRPHYMRGWMIDVPPTIPLSPPRANQINSNAQ